MSQTLTAFILWLHALATVVFIGHYLLLSTLYLPILKQDGGAFLGQISKRSRPWLYASLLVFIVTGAYLMLIDTSYLGFMNFDNFWGIVMLLKHILIFGMIGLGFWYNAVLRVGPMMLSNNNVPLGIRHFSTYSNLMTISGVLVLLLTALAQIE